MLKILEYAPTKDYVEIARRARNLADVYRLQGENGNAEPLYKQALTVTENTLQPDTDLVVQYLHVLADFYNGQSKCDKAEPLAKRALVLRENKLGLDAQLNLTACLDMLGKIYLTCHDLKQAEAAYQRSLLIIQKMAGADQPDVIPYLVNVATVLHAEGSYDQAETHYKKALSISEKNIQSDTSAVPILRHYASLLNDMNKPQEAAVQMAKARAILKNYAL
jgi:tetratricopeptide (TPR) repeat protein